MDPDPFPAIFVIDLQDANKKQIKKNYYFWSHIYIIFKDKKLKVNKAQSSRNLGFSYYFCLGIEGSGKSLIEV